MPTVRKGNILIIVPIIVVIAIVIGLAILTLKGKEPATRQRSPRRVPTTEEPGHPQPTTSDTKQVFPTTGIPLAMSFIRPGPQGHMCDFPATLVLGRHLQDKSGNFDPTVLEEAKKCGGKVILLLSDKTENVLGDSGGLDLNKFRQQISPFDGKIDPYIGNVIIAHGVVDEPHDCNNDWKGKCPTAQEVDQASAISKEYWPNLPTAVNTTPAYINKEAYTWIHTDIIMFQYAYHKGELNSFVDSAISLYNQGKFNEIAWAMQVKSGGCDTFQGCSMSPDQVRAVSAKMCGTGQGKWIGFVWYDESIITADMRNAIADVQETCN